MLGFQIASLRLGNGALGICPMPGRSGDYSDDLLSLRHWAPKLVLTMTTMAEMSDVGARGLGKDLTVAGVDWHHLPIDDYGAPDARTSRLWPAASGAAHETLAQGGRVLIHCFGGCGRSGMAALRLMVEAGETAEAALSRLRDTRPCAVETPAQLTWATRGGPPGIQAKRRP